MVTFRPVVTHILHLLFRSISVHKCEACGRPHPRPYARLPAFHKLGRNLVLNKNSVPQTTDAISYFIHLKVQIKPWF